MVRDVVLVERTGCRHGPRGQRGVVGERGEEGFQLEVRTKRVCGPLCGDVAKTLLRMPEMVVRRHFGLGQGSVCGLSGLLRHDAREVYRQVPATAAGFWPVCPREHLR